MIVSAIKLAISDRVDRPTTAVERAMALLYEAPLRWGSLDRIGQGAGLRKRSISWRRPETTAAALLPSSPCPYEASSGVNLPRRVADLYRHARSRSCRRCAPHAPFANLEMLTAQGPRVEYVLVPIVALKGCRWSRWHTKGVGCCGPHRADWTGPNGYEVKQDGGLSAGERRRQ